ncbi:MAG: mannitol-1-phosphate 5-dehydrogenase [Bacillota bacterium]
MAIQFGAGNIGRGFIGALLSQGGYKVVFADVNEQIINKLNTDGAYTVHTYDAVCKEEKISNIVGVDSRSEKLIPMIAEAELVTTAVGLNILPRIAPTIVKAIQHKKGQAEKTHLNIIACENAVGGSTQLKNAVYELLNDDEKNFAEQWIGFPDCSVDRIVPPVTLENFTDVVVENYYEWNVEESKFKGTVPQIEGMNLVGDLMSYIERKLFTLNTGHAICAYLGVKKGLETIEESIKDEEIHTIVKNAMTESGKGLTAKYKLDWEAHLKYIDKIIGRFRNPHLKDDVTRVGREPLRKLKAGDRLVNPMMTTVGFGNEAENLIHGIAAALHYDNKNDAESVDLQKLIAEKGIKETMKTISGITDEAILEKIETKYKAI